MHKEALEFARSVLEGVKFDRVVEFGSRDINGAVWPLLECNDYHGIDLYPGKGVNEIADAAEWRAPTQVDLIICCEVLEHAQEWDQIIRSASINLKWAGWFLMTCATKPRAPHSGLDGGDPYEGEYYQNVDPDQFRKVCARYALAAARYEVHPDRGDLYGWMQRV